LDKQEKQITMELKQRAKLASNQQDTTLKTLAKQLVQVRQQRSKLHSAKAQVGAMGMHATVTASQIAAVTVRLNYYHPNELVDVLPACVLSNQALFCFHLLY
jgi:hypothetical protein